MSFETCRAFCLVHIKGVFLAQTQVVVILNQVGECLRGLDNPVGMAIEHFKEICVAREEL